MPRIRYALTLRIVRARRLLLACRRQRLFEGTVRHADRIEHPLARDLIERLADRIHQRKLLNQHCATRVLESGERRTFESNGPEIGGFGAVEDLRNRRQRCARGVARKSETIARAGRMAHEHAWCYRLPVRELPHWQLPRF